MICQQSDGKENCPFPSYCKLKGECRPQPTPQAPRPSLEDIERLVDKVELVCVEYGAKDVLTPPAEREHQAKINAARAALLAAIRPLVEK